MQEQTASLATLHVAVILMIPHRRPNRGPSDASALAPRANHRSPSAQCRARSDLDSLRPGDLPGTHRPKPPMTLVEAPFRLDPPATFTFAKIGCSDFQ